MPEGTIAAFAGTGNPFSLGALRPGERVVDVGCGAGIDSLIAARMVGPAGAVVGVDMTPAMLDRARTSAAEGGFEVQATLVAAGVVEFEITARVDVYAGAPQASSAGQFGTLGINCRARKPLGEDEWRAALARLSCRID